MFDQTYPEIDNSIRPDNGNPAFGFCNQQFRRNGNKHMEAI
jgi:hypothetical protein